MSKCNSHCFVGREGKHGKTLDLSTNTFSVDHLRYCHCARRAIKRLILKVKHFWICVYVLNSNPKAITVNVSINGLLLSKFSSLHTSPSKCLALPGLL